MHKEALQEKDTEFQTQDFEYEISYSILFTKQKCSNLVCFTLFLD